MGGKEGCALQRSRFVFQLQRLDSYAEVPLFPGAFTPGCQAHHLPPYIEKAADFKKKGVDIIAVIASNDSWVMNAWGKVNGVKGDGIVSSSIGPLISRNADPEPSCS